ncbi:MAG: hypothetical protein KC613_18430, partial [Myxococcales bacterium]|nr:hypothetical protein [Myxococcales bacterium]
CDGQVDEACQVPLALGAGPRHPAVCGSGELVVVVDDALWRLTEDGAGAWQAGPIEAATSDIPAAHPACSASLVAWLTTPEPCLAPADGPAHCPRASVWALDTDQAFDLTGQSTPGRPAVHDDLLMWHAVVGERPLLKRHDRGQRGVRDVAPELALSDPVPLGPERWAARQWVGGQAEGVLWQGAAFDDGLVPVRPSGPPAAGARWAVWALGEQALWAVPLTGSARTGFQITASPGPHRAPRVVGDHVVWIDEGAGVLRHADLGTGVSAALFAGAVHPDDLAAGPDRVAWIADGADGPALFQHRLAD